MEQVLYQLPDGWKWLKLGDVCSKVTDGSHNPPRAVEGGLPMLSSRNVQDNGLLWENFRLIPEDAFENEHKRTRITEGDVLLTIVGTIGRSCVIRGLDRLFTLQRSVAVLSPEQLISEFLCYQLKAPFIQEYFSNNAKGSAQKGIYLNQLKSTYLVCPPIVEQNRIVKKLDALLTRTDAVIKHLQENLTLANALYASELNEIFPSDANIEALSNKDGWISLSDVCTFENGDRGKNYPSKSAFVVEGIPVVSAGNLGERYIEHKGLNYIAQDRYDLLRSGRIKIGDILFCLRGSLGKVAISKDIDEGVIASSLVIVRPKENILAEYAYKYLKSSLCHQFISYYNNGAAQPNLSAKSLGKFMLPLPSIEQQKEIIEGLDKKYQLNQNLIGALSSKIDSLQDLKASILDAAFKGEL